MTVGAETLVTKQGLDDGESERQVGNELAIHDIEMNQIRYCGDALDLLAQAREVGVQHAR